MTVIMHQLWLIVFQIIFQLFVFKLKSWIYLSLCYSLQCLLVRWWFSLFPFFWLLQWRPKIVWIALSISFKLAPNFLIFWKFSSFGCGKDCIFLLFVYKCIPWVLKVHWYFWCHVIFHCSVYYEQDNNVDRWQRHVLSVKHFISDYYRCTNIRQ